MFPRFIQDFESTFSKCENLSIPCKKQEDCNQKNFVVGCSFCWSDDNKKDQSSFCGPPLENEKEETENLGMHGLSISARRLTNYL